MPSHASLAAAFAACACLAVSGCQTVGDGTIFGGGSSMRQPTATPAANPKARESARLDALESRTQQNTARLDEITQNARHYSQTSDRAASQQSAEVQALREEVETLRKALADLSNRQKMTDKTVSELPAKISSIVNSTQTPDPGRRTGGATKGYEHKVEQGQTLSEIASAYNVPVADILRENKIANPSLIRVGQVLFIPKK